MFNVHIPLKEASDLQKGTVWTGGSKQRRAWIRCHRRVVAGTSACLHILFVLYALHVPSTKTLVFLPFPREGLEPVKAMELVSSQERRSRQ